MENMHKVMYMFTFIMIHHIIFQLLIIWIICFCAPNREIERGYIKKEALGIYTNDTCTMYLKKNSSIDSIEQF